MAILHVHNLLSVKVWKTSEFWHLREDRTDEINERRVWCENQVGKTVKLIIDDKGHCQPAHKLPSIYKGQYEFVWLRGGILMGVEVVLLIIMLIIIFKVKVKDHVGNSLEVM